MTKIMIIEDEPIIRQEVTHLLQSYNYEVHCPSSLDDLDEDIIQQSVDLILLDLTLPKYDGFYLLKKIREQQNVPIIILTSSQKEMDELLSLQLGADDYVQKPFNRQILLAHIQAVLQRSQPQLSQQLTYETMTYTLERHEAKTATETVELTGNEHLIFMTLYRQRGKIMRREDLMTVLWQNAAFVDDNTLTVNVNRLRKKLAQLGLDDCIQTKRGEGYLLK